MEAVIGSRTITDFNFDALVLTHVISGGAPGIDQAIKKYCQKNEIPIEEIRPDYDLYPPYLAPIMRNKEIVKRANIIYAIWDGKSKGTKMVIDYARKLGKKIVILNQNSEQTTNARRV